MLLSSLIIIIQVRRDAHWTKEVIAGGKKRKWAMQWATEEVELAGLGDWKSVSLS